MNLSKICLFSLPLFLLPLFFPLNGIFTIDLSGFSNTLIFSSLIPLFVAVKTYANADSLKLKILSDNRNKAGVYRWTNLLNGKSYVGSSVNLSRRFSKYFSINYLQHPSRGNSTIYYALLKYGYANFSLEILEYCDPENVILREQYYLDELTPDYNILKTAGSLLGFKQSDETRVKISAALTGRTLSEETLAKLKGNTNALGVIRSDETRALISVALTGRTLSDETRALLSAALTGTIRSEETRALIRAKLSQPVYVYSADTRLLIQQFSGFDVARKALRIGSNTLSNHLKSGLPYRGKIFSYTKLPGVGQGICPAQPPEGERGSNIGSTLN